MKPEIEVKFLAVDHDAMRSKLQELGAQLVLPLRIMKRKNYDYPDRALAKKHAWIRLRAEGEKITLAYKQLDSRDAEGMKEAQVKVNSFEDTDAVLTAMGLEQKSYQETKRESWRLGDFEIELDEWPWAKPFIEFEGPDAAGLEDLATKLGLKWDDASFGSLEIAYRAEYDVTDDDINKIPVMTFDKPIPEWLEKRRRA